MTAVWTAFLWHLFTRKARTRHGVLATLCLIGLALLAGKWLLFDLLSNDPLASGTWHYRSGMGVEHWLPRLLNLLILLTGVVAMRRLTAPPPEDEPQGVPLRPLITIIAIGAGRTGLRLDRRPLRLAGLALFAAAGFKVVFSDLADLDIVWRLLAFGLLGGAMLVAAFGYLSTRQQPRQ